LKILQSFSANAKVPAEGKFASNISKAQSKITKGFTKAEFSGSGTSRGCDIIEDVDDLELKADAYIQDLLDEMYAFFCDDGECLLYFIDEEDGGDAPFAPGCHYSFSDAACSEDKTFFQGDVCLGGPSYLMEWVRAECHQARDKKFYSCDYLCRSQFGTHGRCATALCPSGNSSAVCECCQGGSNCFVKDKEDAGNDPLVPGCHYAYSDAACAQDEVFHEGDSCADVTVLNEWTDSGCHQNADLVTVDCDQYCTDNFGIAGVCVQATCASGNPSAKCVCSTPTTTTTTTTTTTQAQP
jgi:hypothetical protein